MSSRPSSAICDGTIHEPPDRISIVIAPALDCKTAKLFFDVFCKKRSTSLGEKVKWSSKKSELSTVVFNKSELMTLCATMIGPLGRGPLSVPLDSAAARQ